MSELEAESELDEDESEDSQITYCPSCGFSLDYENSPCPNCGYSGFDADEVEGTEEE